MENNIEEKIPVVEPEKETPKMKENLEEIVFCTE